MLRQLQKCQLFGALLSILIQVNGFQLPFHITNSGKTNITVHEGENVEFTCIASDVLFQFCAFERANSGTICRRKWRKVTDCDALKNRAEFTEGPNPSVYKKKCKLLLKSVTLEDEGKWTCVLEKDTLYQRFQAKKEIFLTVIKNCQHNTDGHNCDICAKGFYDNSFEGTLLDCQPCTCNIAYTRNNSNICSKTQRGQCSCLEGYAGRDCSYCKYLITYFF